MMSSFDCRHEVFKVGNSSPVDLLTAIRTIEDGLGKPAEIVWSPPKSTDVPLLFGDTAKAR